MPKKDRYRPFERSVNMGNEERWENGTQVVSTTNLATTGRPLGGEKRIDKKHLRER